MGKRFTDTNKYKKEFIRGLPGPYKLLWDYLYHECDHAGIWIVDFEIAQIYLGKDMPVNYNEALALFNDGEERIIEVAKNRWFIVPFIEFQYGTLNPENRAHAAVLKILKSYNIGNNNKEIKPLTSPLQGAMDMDKDKEKDMDKEKGVQGEKPKTEKEPAEDFKNLFSENFLPTWQDYRDHRGAMKKKFKSMKSENLAMAELHRISGGDEGTAKKIVEKSIASGWQGLFPLDESRLSGKTINLTTSQKINNLVNHGSHLSVEDELWASVPGTFVQGRLQLSGETIILEQAGKIYLTIYPTDGFKSNRVYQLRPGNTIQRVWEVLKNKMVKTA